MPAAPSSSESPAEIPKLRNEVPNQPPSPDIADKALEHPRGREHQELQAWEAGNEAGKTWEV